MFFNNLFTAVSALKTGDSSEQIALTLQPRSMVGPLCHIFLPHSVLFHEFLQYQFYFFKSKKTCHIYVPTPTQTQKFCIMQFTGYHYPVGEFARWKILIVKYAR